MHSSSLLLPFLALAAMGVQAETAPPATQPAHTANGHSEVPPPLPETYGDAQQGEIDQAGAAVTIERRDSVTIETFRVNGQITKIKITPDKGRPYYLLDNDGDGSFDIQRNELDNPPLNQWRILEW